jgi:FkbM family methyltransferase
MSAIVGSEGKALVVEPDERNITKLDSYVRKNRISNIAYIKMGVWKSKGQMKFTVYEDRSSTNVLSVGQERIINHNTTPQDYASRSNVEVEIEVDSLDNIIDRAGFSPDFINMTINGTEYEAIQGLEKTLHNKPCIAFPIWGPRDWFESAFMFLESRGYDIVICDAPYTKRAPTVNGKVKFWRNEEIPQHFYACAINEDMKKNIKSKDLFELAKLQKNGDGRFEFIM